MASMSWPLSSAASTSGGREGPAWGMAVLCSGGDEGGFITAECEWAGTLPILAFRCKERRLLLGLAEGRKLTGRQTVEGVAAFYLERGAKQVVVKLKPEGAESG